jgi:hypothetical protein
MCFFHFLLFFYQKITGNGTFIAEISFSDLIRRNMKPHTACPAIEKEVPAKFSRLEFR